MSIKCQTPGQMADSMRGRRSVVPRDRESLAACLKVAAVGAAAWFGVPAVMALLHMGGVW